MSDTPQLKSHREAAKKTQAEVAAIISEMTGQPVTQGQVSRWEENPDSVPIKMARAYAQAVGVTMDELLEPPLGRDDMRIEPGDPYVALRRNVGLLRACLEAAPAPVDTEGIPRPAQVEDLCARVERKPNVVLAGHFDAGKSRLSNALLGDDILPTRYQPTTASGTWMFHIDDRPAWCGEVVYVFAKGFDPTRIRDADYCRSVLVASGSIEILAAYAAHPPGGRNERDLTVVAFLDAPILRACNLLDVPGNQHSEQDTAAAAAGLARADVLIYVSRAQGFLDEQDIIQLRAQLRQLPTMEARGVRPLENLILVASHAHPKMSKQEVDDLCDAGAVTMMRELGTTVFDERAQRSKTPTTLHDVRRRIFPFWFETPERRDPLRRALTDTLGDALPAAWNRGADEEVESFRNGARGACDQSIAQYRRVLADVEAARREFQERRALETARAEMRRAKKQTVLHAVATQWMGSKLFLKETYPNIVNEDAVKQFLKTRYKSKKDAEKHAAGAVVDELQSALMKDTAKRSQTLVPLVEDFLGQFGSVGAGEPARPDGSPAVGVAFDARGAFLGGMAGLGTVGALGAWAATLGNLGGYIIVAKVASLLAALGIEFGGSAALVSLVAALGGPAVVAVALATALAIGIGWLFGESWESRLAGKIVKALEKNKVQQAFEKSINDYWQGTQNSFVVAGDAVEQSYQRHLKDLERVITGSITSPDELQRLVARLERVRDFFAGLPWRVS